MWSWPVHTHWWDGFIFTSVGKYFSRSRQVQNFRTIKCVTNVQIYLTMTVAKTFYLYNILISNSLFINILSPTVCLWKNITKRYRTSVLWKTNNIDQARHVIETGPVSRGKISPLKNRRGGDFLTDGDRETFAPRRFIHDRRLWENCPLLFDR